MALRPLLAGPSRIAPLLTFSRSISIPHPDTIPAAGETTFFQIKAFDKIPDMPHVYACVRAAEKALGTSVISIDVQRDIDLLRPLPFINIRTLHPVPHTKPITVTIVPPRVSSDIYGGPSLADIEAALKSSPQEPMNGETGFGFRIERGSIPPKRTWKPRQFTDKRARERQQADNVKVLDALENAGGAWAEVARKWAHLRPSSDHLTPRPTSRRSERSSGLENADEAELSERLDTEDARAQRRQDKHHRHEEEIASGSTGRTASTKERPDLTGEETEIDRSRRHSSQINEQRHAQRRERRADKEAESVVSDWKFSIGATPSSEVDMDGVQLSPEQIEATNEARFSLKRFAQTTNPAPEVEEDGLVVVEEKAAPGPDAATVSKTRRAKEAEAAEAKRDAAVQKAVEIARRDAESKARRQARDIEMQAQEEVRRKDAEKRALERDAQAALDAETRSAKDVKTEETPGQGGKASGAGSEKKGMISRFFG